MSSPVAVFAVFYYMEDCGEFLSSLFSSRDGAERFVADQEKQASYRIQEWRVQS